MTALQVLNFNSNYTIDPAEIAADQQPPVAKFPKVTNLVGSDTLVPASQSNQLPFTVDIGTAFDAKLDPRIPHRGLSTQSLLTQITSIVDQNVKDKIFFDVIPLAATDYNISVNGDDKFISFDMMLASPYDNPDTTHGGGTYYIIHMQAFQNGQLHPPFFMEVDFAHTNSTAVTLKFAYRNDNNAATTGIEIGRFSMPRDIWFHLAFELMPSPLGSSPGRIKVWLNRESIVDWSGNWGHAVGNPNPFTGTTVTPAIQIDLGCYRRRQPTTQTALFSNFKYGTTLSDIDLGVTQIGQRPRRIPIKHLREILKAQGSSWATELADTVEAIKPKAPKLRKVVDEVIEEIPERIADPIDWGAVTASLQAAQAATRATASLKHAEAALRAIRAVRDDDEEIEEVFLLFFG